jgi:putative membrane protein
MTVVSPPAGGDADSGRPTSGDALGRQANVAQSVGLGGQGMNSFLARWVVNAVGVVVAAAIVPGWIHYTGWLPVVIFAAVLGLLNAVVRPALVVLTMPLTCLTLGFFTLVVNGLIFWLAARVTIGLEVRGFAGAFLGALIVSAISLIAAFLTRSNHRQSRKP